LIDLFTYLLTYLLIYLFLYLFIYSLQTTVVCLSHSTLGQNNLVSSSGPLQAAVDLHCVTLALFINVLIIIIIITTLQYDNY